MKKTLLFIFFLLPSLLFAQAQYQPYSYHFYQKLNKVQYGAATRQHTALKPFLIDSALQPRYDSLMNCMQGGYKVSWMERKDLSELLIEVEIENSLFYADILSDRYLGSDFAAGGKNTFLRTIGVQLGGNVDDRFSYHLSPYNHRGIFRDYINDF